MRRLATLVVSLCAVGASCDLVVGVDWDAYRDSADAPPCDGACAGTTTLVDDDAALSIAGLARATDAGLLLIGHASGASSELGLAGDGERAFAAKLCPSGAVVWSVAWGSGDSPVRLFDLAPDEDGGAYVVGAFRGSIAVGSPPSQLVTAAPNTEEGLVAHIRSSGEVDWVVRVGGPVIDVDSSPADNANPLAITALEAPGEQLFDEVACDDSAGRSETALVVARLTADGRCSLRTTTSVTASKDAGAVTSDLTFTPTGELVFVGEYDALEQPFPLAGAVDEAQTIPVGEHGLIFNRATSDLDFEPVGLGRSPDYEGPAAGASLTVAQDPETHDYWIVGTTVSTFAYSGVEVSGNEDGSMFVLRVEEEGNQGEALYAGQGAGPSAGGGLGFDAEGKVYVLGWASGNVDWQGKSEVVGEADARLLLTVIGLELDPFGQRPIERVSLDRGVSRTAAAFLASLPGCAPSSAIGFSGTISLADGAESADGPALLVVPALDATALEP